MGNIKVGRYDNPQSVGWAGWIEDEERTWIAFIDLEGKPRFFLNRDETGKVLDPNPPEVEAYLNARAQSRV